MPLWQIYHPPNTFTTDAAKSALTASITAHYTRINLPAFYVVVTFHLMTDPTTSMWVGGQKVSDINNDNDNDTTTTKPFIRITISHIAVTLPNDDAAYNRSADGITALLKPHVADLGYAYEFHVEETERRLWRVQGLRPPPWGSEAERVWARENRAVPWEGGGEGEVR